MDFRHKIQLLLNKYRHLTLIGGAGCLLLLILFYLFKPDTSVLDSIDFSQTIYDRNGKLLRIVLSEDEKYRLYSPINQISPLLKTAILLKEDRFYYYHPGVNPGSIIRMNRIRPIFLVMI